MNQEKIGKFIASCRKKKNMTQMQLAEKLNVSDRAVSKWETGKGIPDVSLMIDLCNYLGISVNELLSGEYIDDIDLRTKNEELLLDLYKLEVNQNKKIMFYSFVIGIMSTIYFLFNIFIADYLISDFFYQHFVIFITFILFIVGIAFALKIETETGYYLCRKCKYRFVPSFFQVFFAMHNATTRYLKCPECNKRSWCIKVLGRK